MEESLWLDILVGLGLIILFSALAATGLIFWDVIRPARRRSRIREGILANKRELLTEGRLYAVNYASQVTVYRFLAPKSIPCDATGVLVVADDEVVCTCVSLEAHDEFELRFAPPKSTVEWIGSERLICRRTFHWLRIEHEGRSHYFTDDRSWKAWRSRTNTRALYEDLCAVLGRTHDIHSTSLPMRERAGDTGNNQHT
jgi:hypothetical protein